MKLIFKIARMELQKLFYSPIAWLVLIIFALQTNMSMMELMSRNIKSDALGYGLDNLTYSTYGSLFGLFSTVIGYLFLYIPLLTMGLISREFSSGSIKLLYSSPISNLQIVLGKFLSMMIFGLAMMMLIFLEVLLGAISIEHFDWPLVFTGMLSIYLVICTFASIGLFMSSLTSYQIVAAIGTFATLFLLGQVGSMWQEIHWVRDVTYWLSINGRSDTIRSGLICSEDVLYFILVSALFISFTFFRLKGIWEKSAGYISSARYATAFLIVAVIGYISTQPRLMSYYDASRTKFNTLTENSQKILAGLKGKVKVTTYGNLFSVNIANMAPGRQKMDMSRYNQYARFHPEMEFDYKYYYALPLEESALKSHQDRHKGLTEKQAMEKVAAIYDIDSEKFKPGSYYRQEADLPGELNRIVTMLRSEDGRVAYLRLFNDSRLYPNESQITAAFRKLTMKLPQVQFVKGHGERGLNDFGSRGYFTLAKEKPYRFSLVNNGFDFTERELSAAVPADVNILVITDVKTPFGETETKNLNDYIARGGNLLLACDLKRQDNMNPLVAQFGVAFMPGQVVEYNKGYGMDLITAAPTKEGQALAQQFKDVVKWGGLITMEGAVGISYTQKSGFSYTPVFTSDTLGNLNRPDSVGSWNELHTTDLVDGVPVFDVETGEQPGPMTTALAISRKVGQKTQKIMLLGDADCFSNGELSRDRAGINAMNYNLATGIFSWLSDNQAPTDITRPEPPDNKLNIKKSSLPFLNAFYKIIIPAALLAAFLLIWARRKGR